MELNNANYIGMGSGSGVGCGTKSGSGSGPVGGITSGSDSGSGSGSGMDPGCGLGIGGVIEAFPGSGSERRSLMKYVILCCVAGVVIFGIV